MKVTHRLSTSESIRSHSSKWRKEQLFILNHTSNDRILTKETHRLSRSESTSSQSSKWRKEQPFIFTCIHIVSKCEPLMKATYWLSTIECTSSHRSSWRKEQPLILNHTSNPRILTKKSYCLSTSEYTSSQAASGEKINHSFFVRMLTKYESNLPPEHKWSHKFTQQQMEKRATIHS